MASQLTLLSDASLRRWGSLLAMQGKLMTRAFNQKKYLTRIAAQKAKIDFQRTVLLANMSKDKTGADNASAPSSGAASSDSSSPADSSDSTQTGSLASKSTREDPSTGSADTGAA